MKESRSLAAGSWVFGAKAGEGTMEGRTMVLKKNRGGGGDHKTNHRRFYWEGRSNG